MFKNNISVYIYHGFLDYILLSSNDCLMEGSSIQLARLDVWVAAMLACLGQRKKRTGYRQKVYTRTFISYLSVAFNQLNGPILR